MPRAPDIRVRILLGGAGGAGGCFPTVGDDGGGGAGGRIAVYYEHGDTFGGFTTSSVNGAPGGGHVGAPGTMVFIETPANALRVSQHLDFAPDSTAHFGALALDDQASLVLGGGAQLTVDDDFAVTQGSTVVVEGKRRDGQINGQWSGAGAMITAATVRIDADSRISADEQGYRAGLGPGAATWDAVNTAGGGGYGGVGGSGNGPNAGGPTYGGAAAPVELGSGGASAHAPAGVGGGAVTLYSDTLLLDGSIVANGANASSVGCSGAAPGGGAGGSVLIVTRILAGDGALHADGGAGGEGGCTGSGDDGGGGGGGRTVVHYSLDQGFAGVTTSSVNGGLGGSGRSGAPGTLLFISCIGDCDGDGHVTVDELVRMVNIALGNAGVLACLAGDSNRDSAIAVNEIIIGVNNALGGCPVR